MLQLFMGVPKFTASQYHLGKIPIYQVVTRITIFNVLFLSQAIKFKTISYYVTQ